MNLEKDYMLDEEELEEIEEMDEDLEEEQASAPSSQDKHDNFIRVCTPRVQKAAKAIGLIANCSSKSRYAYSEEEIEKMFRFLENVLNDTKSKFIEEKKKDSFSF